MSRMEFSADGLQLIAGAYYAAIDLRAKERHKDSARHHGREAICHSVQLRNEARYFDGQSMLPRGETVTAATKLRDASGDLSHLQRLRQASNSFLQPPQRLMSKPWCRLMCVTALFAVLSKAPSQRNRAGFCKRPAFVSCFVYLYAQQQNVLRVFDFAIARALDATVMQSTHASTANDRSVFATCAWRVHGRANRTPPKSAIRHKVLWGMCGLQSNDAASRKRCSRTNADAMQTNCTPLSSGGAVRFRSSGDLSSRARLLCRRRRR